MKVIIYQLPIESDNIFRGYNEDRFDFSEYKKIYESDYYSIDDRQFNIYKFLEDIFYTFNCQHPSNFAGHSLSVSDVVQIDNRYFYCDILGWQELFQLTN